MAKLVDVTSEDLQQILSIITEPGKPLDPAHLPAVADILMRFEWAVAAVIFKLSDSHGESENTLNTFGENVAAKLDGLWDTFAEEKLR